MHTANPRSQSKTSLSITHRGVRCTSSVAERAAGARRRNDAVPEGWSGAGSAWIGRTIFRTIFGADGAPSSAWVRGRVVAWLPADRSDFVDTAGRPAPLWHVVYEGGGVLDGDGEDLEEFELEESMPPGAAVAARAHNDNHGAAVAATTRRAAMGEVRRHG